MPPFSFKKRLTLLACTGLLFFLLFASIQTIATWLNDGTINRLSQQGLAGLMSNQAHSVPTVYAWWPQKSTMNYQPEGAPHLVVYLPTQPVDRTITRPIAIEGGSGSYLTMGRLEVLSQPCHIDRAWTEQYVLVVTFQQPDNCRKISLRLLQT